MHTPIPQMALSLEATMREHLRRYFAAHAGALPPSGLHDRVLTLVERPLIEETLQMVGYNQLKAAALLGINRNTLRKKMRQLGIAAGKER